jgi:hypothetical protein
VSHYIRILNTIKANVGSLPLTPSQTACRACIVERLAYPGVVNLYGLQGVGKTMLGWAMNAEGQALYVAHPPKLRQLPLSGAPIIFVDNCEPDRTSFRRLLGTLESAGVEKVVVVTHPPADDYVFRSELTLTHQDIEVVRQNLKRLGHFIPRGDWANLWFGLLQSAREEP